MIFKKINKNAFINFFNTTRFKTTLWYALIFLALEIFFAVSAYLYTSDNSLDRLDLALKTQATSILRLVKERQIDLDTFQPDATYQSPEDIVWDLLYDVLVFDRRNYYIQISQGRRLIFKTRNLGRHTLRVPVNIKDDASQAFDLDDETVTEGEIRCYQLTDKRYKVVVAYPKEHITQTLGTLRDYFIVMAPIFFVVALMGGAIISRKSLSRIDAVIKKTEDITAQKLNEQIPGGEYKDEYGRLVNKMNEMIERIKTSVDFMNQFSVAAAHELKTPLTILRGEIEIALKSEKPVEEYIEILKSNYEETIRLIKIIDNLFFISKSDNRLISLEQIDTDAREYLTGVINSLRLIGKEKNIELALEVKSDAVLCLDHVLMKQAILNLIDNAVKYGYEGKPINVVGEKISDKEYQISIINEGDGIPEESQQKIFDRFYRLESSRNRKTGGVGLGLSVVYSIMELHKGRVQVTSVQNGKTNFSLILPA
jgi:heavy metal sensor kinase